MRRILALSLISTAAVAAAGANLKSESDLVLIDATVVDGADRFHPNLRPSDFRLFDHGVEQRIVSFSLEDAPLSVVVVFDASGSMRDSMPLARRAMKGFLAGANPADQFSIVTVHDRPELTLPFAVRFEEVADRLASATAGGRTALLDAVYLAANYVKTARNPRRALLVLSDGEDNNSRYTERELLRVLRETNASLYSIGMGIRTPPGFSAEQTGPTGADILAELSENTGGRYFEAQRPEDLPGIFKRIDIRYRYVLGYAPSAVPRDGRYHRVALKLTKDARTRHLRAYYRPGYYSPRN